MSRGQDLIGVLRGVKNVGKKLVKGKRADLDNLVHGTTFKETVDGVAVSVSRILKAVDKIKKADGGAKGGERKQSAPEAPSSSSSCGNDTAKKTEGGDGRTKCSSPGEKWNLSKSRDLLCRPTPLRQR